MTVIKSSAQHVAFFYTHFALRPILQLPDENDVLERNESGVSHPRREQTSVVLYSSALTRTLW